MKEKEMLFLTSPTSESKIRLWKTKKKVFYLTLKWQWENFLFKYKQTKRKLFSLKENKNIFSKNIKIELSSLNYLILAKLINNENSLVTFQKKLKNLGNLNSKILQLNKVFSRDTKIKRIFYFLINYLFWIKLNKIFLEYQEHLRKSELIGKRQEAQIQNFNYNYVVNSRNYSQLTILWNKFFIWLLKINFLDKNLKFQLETNYFISKNENNKNDENRISLKKNFNKNLFLEVKRKKNLKLIKNILNKNKTGVQKILIKKINNFLKNLDTFEINTIRKTESENFNTILSSLLWQWGFSRHKKKTAKWIKDKYWYNHNKKFLFSI